MPKVEIAQESVQKLEKGHQKYVGIERALSAEDSEVFLKLEMSPSQIEQKRTFSHPSRGNCKSS